MIQSHTIWNDISKMLRHDFPWKLSTFRKLSRDFKVYLFKMVKMSKAISQHTKSTLGMCVLTFQDDSKSEVVIKVNHFDSFESLYDVFDL